MDNITELKEGRRKKSIDEYFTSKEIGPCDYSNYLFIRLSSKDTIFNNVDFRYCIFDSAYLRKCKFNQCNFTGCKFISSNLYESCFMECNFEYATFEKTNVTSDILNSAAKGKENLRLKIARSLRENYRQLGDKTAENIAIDVELESTEIFLKKACNSKEDYFRHKYKGRKRAKKFLEYYNFRFLKFIWGNGESLLRFFRFIIIVILAMGVKDCFINNFFSLNSILVSLQTFSGAIKPQNYSSNYLMIICFLRFISGGLFLSILIRRLCRR